MTMNKGEFAIVWTQDTEDGRMQEMD